ncbi:glutamine synthetase [Agromyces flavus]|uniref:Glutamine synthetase n=1 Tax=Agromyces flavus TaxID=589382 RepID=A0A1H2A047_9MICO|nr:glutamine synthetase family protein [Agromyces flavus]MCP2367344.1 glutamine synthetase [Agromyces flavus]GGI45914.1 glutamine synthetase [Agromyces flavus]SDT38856.1 glutamine synthetase [Agromyces flavus]
MNRFVGFDQVRALLVSHVDNAGISRVKALPHGRLLSASTYGVTNSNSVGFLFSVDDHLNATPALDPIVGDLRGIADLSAVAMLDADSGLAWAPADLYALDGSPHPTCTRSALRRVIDDADDSRLGFTVGFELECTVFRDEPMTTSGAPTPATTGPAYSTRSLLEVESFALAAVDALEFAGVTVQQFHPEFGTGQLEFAFAPQDPLRAVDELVLARVVLTRVARAHGLLISFAPVPIIGGASNGCHVHLSAAREGRRNVFAEPAATHGVSEEGGRIIAGILDRLEEGVALLGGSVLSFTRLRPHSWAGADLCWGPANREAAIRYVPGQAGMGAEQANLEVKPVDGAANPYLAVAAILASAFDGVAREAVPPKPVTVDPSTLTAAQRRGRGIRSLPADLGSALDRLEASQFFRGVFGDVLLDAYLATRRHEWEAYGERPPEEVAELVRWRY